MAYKIAVVGATGNVGREMLSILAEKGIKSEDVFAIASEQSSGQSISYGQDEELKVHPLKEFDFKKVQIVLASAGAAISAQIGPLMKPTGAIMIDNSSHYRMDPDVPLIVPEVNPQAIQQAKQKNIISNPNCSTIQMMVALKPLHDIARIKRIVVSTYQSVSGAGKKAMDELFNQTRHVYMGQELHNEEFAKKIAFNVIPQIDRFMEGGDTKEEWKMMVETKKILDPKIKVSATCVRVPVFIGHSLSVNVEFESEITLEQAQKALKKTKGVRFLANNRGNDELSYITPMECAGEDSVFVSRLREDPSVEHGLNMWVVADNLRKGAALNAIQIMDLYMKSI